MLSYRGHCLSQRGGKLLLFRVDYLAQVSLNHFLCYLISEILVFTSLNKAVVMHSDVHLEQLLLYEVHLAIDLVKSPGFVAILIVRVGSDIFQLLEVIRGRAGSRGRVGTRARARTRTRTRARARARAKTKTKTKTMTKTRLD